MRRTVLLGVIAVGCGAHRAEPTAPIGVVAESLDASRPDEPEAGEPSGPSSIARAACGERPCRTLKERAAGADARGRKVAVAAFAIGAPCDTVEHWAVARDGTGELVEPPRLIFRTPCEDKEGAHVEVRVGEGLAERIETGGTFWRFRARTTYGLAPVHRRTEDNAAWSTTAPNFEHSTWSWDDFAGHVRWYAPRCGPGGREPATSGDFGELGERPLRREYLAIPQVEMEDAFRAAKWQTTHLGRCAALASSAGTSGYVTQGDPGDEDDASLRVVASTHDELFVELKDDRWIGGAKRRVAGHEDVLEIVLGSDLPSPQRRCAEAPPPLRSFRVRVSDGKLSPGLGKVDLARVAVERHAQTFGEKFGWVHFKVRVPVLPGALALVYRDGDDGRTRERAIATAKVSASDPLSLGALHPIPRTLATCRVREGALEPDVTDVTDVTDVGEW